MDSSLLNFSRQGKAHTDGSGQIQVASIPGVGAIGTLLNYQEIGSFDGQGVAATFELGRLQAGVA